MPNIYSKIKVLIADDHQMVRDGLQVIAKKIDEFEIIGEASNGEELLHLTRRLSPDVILTDVKMPKMNGIEATKIIKHEFPHIGIVALSSYDEESLILDMLNAGAKGYLLKNTGKQELKEAVKAVYKDEPYYCKDIKLKLAELISSGGHLSSQNKVRDKFTERELEVITGICQGSSSKQIAAKMVIKTRTVERYRDAIMDKMGVSNAPGIAMFAVKHGLYSDPNQKK